MSAPVLDHERANAQLLDFAYGELPAAERAQLEQHLPSCERCRADLAALQGTRRTMQELEALPAPEQGLESLLAYADQQAARQAAPKRSRWVSWAMTLVPLGLAASIGVFLVGRELPKPAEVSTTQAEAEGRLLEAEPAPAPAPAVAVAAPAPTTPPTDAPAAPAPRPPAEEKPEVAHEASLGDLKGAAAAADGTGRAMAHTKTVLAREDESDNKPAKKESARAVGAASAASPLGGALAGLGKAAGEAGPSANSGAGAASGYRWTSPPAGDKAGQVQMDLDAAEKQKAPGGDPADAVRLSFRDETPTRHAKADAAKPAPAAAAPAAPPPPPASVAQAPAAAPAPVVAAKDDEAPDVVNAHREVVAAPTPAPAATPAVTASLERGASDRRSLPPPSPADLLRTAKQQHDQGQVQLAVQTATDLVNRFPTSALAAEACWDVVTWARELGNEMLAEQMSSRLVSQYPSSGYAARAYPQRQALPAGAVASPPKAARAAPTEFDSENAATTR